MSSIEIRPKPHDIRPGVTTHEVWIDNVFMASITPGDDPLTLRIASRHIDDIVRFGGAMFEFRFRSPG